MKEEIHGAKNRLRLLPGQEMIETKGKKKGERGFSNPFFGPSLPRSVFGALRYSSDDGIRTKNRR